MSRAKAFSAAGLALALDPLRADLLDVLDQVLAGVLDLDEADDLSQATGAGAGGDLVIGQGHPGAAVGLRHADDISGFDDLASVLADGRATHRDVGVALEELLAIDPCLLGAGVDRQRNVHQAEAESDGSGGP